MITEPNINSELRWWLTPVILDRLVEVSFITSLHAVDGNNSYMKCFYFRKTTLKIKIKLHVKTLPLFSFFFFYQTAALLNQL